MGLHCENGNAPIWPDLSWFYCQKAPLTGSQTTLCDGQLVLKDFSQRLVDKFSNQKIRYRRSVPGDKWRRIVCHYNPTINHVDDVKFSDLESIVGLEPGTTVTYHEESDSVSYIFVVSAIQRSPFNDKKAFANSILGPSFNYESPVIDFADGEAFDATLLKEIEDVTSRHTHIVGWQDGDVVMIDNRRVMHGRERVLDPDRKIFNALSYR
ncbi:MAG: TauD/TfdA family dioxygenase [Pseudomonas sp.]